MTCQVRDTYSSQAAALYKQELDTRVKQGTTEEEEASANNNKNNHNIGEKETPMAEPSNKSQKAAPPKDVVDNNNTNIDNETCKPNICCRSESPRSALEYYGLDDECSTTSNSAMKDDSASTRVQCFVEAVRGRFTTTSRNAPNRSSSAGSLLAFSSWRASFVGGGGRRSSKRRASMDGAGVGVGTTSSPLSRSISASSPMVTYLGRSFRADTVVSRPSQSRSNRMCRRASLQGGVDINSSSLISQQKQPQARRASCFAGSSAASTNYTTSPNNMDDEEFLKIKASLKAAGAWTNMSLKHKLFTLSTSNNDAAISCKNHNNSNPSQSRCNSPAEDEKPTRPSRSFRRSPWSVNDANEDESSAVVIVISPVA